MLTRDKNDTRLSYSYNGRLTGSHLCDLSTGATFNDMTPNPDDFNSIPLFDIEYLRNGGDGDIVTMNY